VVLVQQRGGEMKESNNVNSGFPGGRIKDNSKLKRKKKKGKRKKKRIIRDMGL